MNWVRKYFVSFSEVIRDHIQSKIVFSCPDWPAHGTWHRQRFLQKFSCSLFFFAYVAGKRAKHTWAHRGSGL